MLRKDWVQDKERKQQKRPTVCTITAPLGVERNITKYGTRRIVEKDLIKLQGRARLVPIINPTFASLELASKRPLLLINTPKTRKVRTLYLPYKVIGYENLVWLGMSGCRDVGMCTASDTSSQQPEQNVYSSPRCQGAISHDHTSHNCIAMVRIPGDDVEGFAPWHTQI